MKIPPSLFGSLVISLAVASTAPAQTPASADAILAKIRERAQVPGLAAAVVRDGKIVATGASGVREIGQPGNIQLDDQFLIASCTKPMTRLLLGRLAQAGTLRLDATLPQLLPGVMMRPEYEQVTLADLVAHTAGLPPYTRITPRDTPIIFELKGTPMEQRNRLVEHVLMENPVGAVGKDFAYSNAGFVVLGNIIERAAGKPWESLIQEEVFVPLAIRSATIGFPAEAGAHPRPRGHQRTPGGYAVATYSPPDDGIFAPAGGVCLTVGDFARFAAAMLDADAGTDTPFLKKMTAAALPPLVPASARRGEGLIVHGGQGTFTAALGVWPAKGLGIVVCVNGGDADAACDAAIEALRAAFAPDVPAALAPTDPGSGPKLGVMLRAEPDGPVIFESVIPGSPADAAGIRAGDELVTLDGKTFKAMDPSAAGLALRAPGVTIGLRRDGKILEIRMPGGAPPTPPPSK